jgi:PAS domain S-box-containing protein
MKILNNGTFVRLLDRKDAELIASAELLACAEEKLRLKVAAIAHVADSIVVTDLHGTILWTNPAFSLMTGYAADEAEGQNQRVLQSGRHDPSFYQDLWQTILAGRTWRGRFINRRKDGTFFQVEQAIAPVRGDDGEITHFVGVMTDITARTQAEAELHSSERKYRLLLESTGEGIYGIDCKGRCTFINRAGAKMIGREPSAVLGQEMHELVQPRRADGRVFPAGESPILKALRAGEHCDTNAEVFWRADGTAFPVEYRSNPIREDGAIIGAVVMFTDITEKKKFETERLRTQRIESIGRLASGIAHDMNNILAPIMMSAPLLRMTLTPKDVEKTLATIETSAKRGADLVKQLLTFGRGVEGDRGPVAPEALIREIMRIAAQTFPRSITFITTLAPGGWPVCGDASQLHQVLLNLLVNARDSMPQGGTLTVATANVQFPPGAALLPSEAPPGPYVRLSVADTGFGIPPDIVDKVFDPFFTTKEMGHGTGLGLSTLLGVVKSHGGFVRLSSEVSRGSTFEIYLPATPGATEKSSENALPPSPSAGSELILVVDDEESIRNILRETLERQGYRVVTANDGAEAAAVFARNPTAIELVIADLDMPVLDGLSLVKLLRKIRPEVKVLISSGAGATKTMQKRLEELRALPVDAILHKPYSAARILSAVASALAGKPSRLEKSPA